MGYRVGDLIRLSALFTSNITGAPTDPSTTAFSVRDPQGGITAPTPIHDTVGTFHYDLTVTLPGEYRWVATGTGNVQVSGEGSFPVDPPELLMPADFTWKQNDTGPAFVYTLTRDDGTPGNLAGVNASTGVTFSLRSLADASPLTLTGAATVLSAGASQVAYTPGTGDTALAGDYLADWKVTMGNGTVQTFPQSGYLWVRIDPSLSAMPQLIVDLLAVKAHMNITNVDRTRDERLIRLIQAVRPVIEERVGPIVPTVYEEWHDGGHELIQLVRIPATGYGTNPVMQVIAASEYRGPIEYPLAQIASPAFGSIYSVFLNPLTGTLTRRTAGGRTIPFMPGRDSVHVWYRSGQSSTPENVAFAACEAVRVGVEWTQQLGRGRRTVSDDQEIGPSLTYELSRVVRVWLGPARRAPSFA
jgi:hypothetical protein